MQVNADEDESHLVAQVKGIHVYLFVMNQLLTFAFNPVPDVEQEVDDKSPWYLFNDFLVRRIRKEEVLSFKGTWKVSQPHKHNPPMMLIALCADTMRVAVPTSGQRRNIGFQLLAI